MIPVLRIHIAIILLSQFASMALTLTIQHTKESLTLWTNQQTGMRNLQTQIKDSKDSSISLKDQNAQSNVGSHQETLKDQNQNGTLTTKNHPDDKQLLNLLSQKGSVGLSDIKPFVKQDIKQLDHDPQLNNNTLSDIPDFHVQNSNKKQNHSLKNTIPNNLTSLPTPNTTQIPPKETSQLTVAAQNNKKNQINKQSTVLTEENKKNSTVQGSNNSVLADGNSINQRLNGQTEDRREQNKGQQVKASKETQKQKLSAQGNHSIIIQPISQNDSLNQVQTPHSQTNTHQASNSGTKDKQSQHSSIGQTQQSKDPNVNLSHKNQQPMNAKEDGGQSLKTNSTTNTHEVQKNIQQGKHHQSETVTPQSSQSNHSSNKDNAGEKDNTTNHHNDQDNHNDNKKNDHSDQNDHNNQNEHNDHNDHNDENDENDHNDHNQGTVQWPNIFEPMSFKNYPMTPWTIAGICIAGCLSFFFILIILCWCSRKFCRCCKQKKQEDKSQENLPNIFNEVPLSSQRSNRRQKTNIGSYQDDK